MRSLALLPLISAPCFSSPHMPRNRTSQCDEAAMGLVAVLLGECMLFGGEGQVRCLNSNAKCARESGAPRRWSAPTHSVEEGLAKHNSANLTPNAAVLATSTRTRAVLPPPATPSPPMSAWPSISRAWRPCVPCPPFQRVKDRCLVRFLLGVGGWKGAERVAEADSSSQPSAPLLISPSPSLVRHGHPAHRCGRRPPPRLHRRV